MSSPPDVVAAAPPANPNATPDPQARALAGVAMVGASWAVDVVMLALMWLADGAREDAVVIMGAGALLSLVLFYSLIRSGLNTRFRDRFLALPQLAFATAVGLACAWRSPEIGMLAVLSIFVIFTFGSLRLRLRPRQLALAWLATSVGIALLVMSPRGLPSVPLATPVQTLLSLVWIVLALGRCGFVGMYGASLRKRLIDRNVELDEARGRLQVLATRDSLTGVFNRRAVTQVVADAIDAGRPVAIVLADLDHFKAVNDRFGHPVGDQVLQRFVEIAGRGLRAADVLGRFGGEEFLLALPGISGPAPALAVAERIRAAVAAHDWTTLHPELMVTASFGIAVAQPGESMPALVKRADRGLYAAKRAGRNRSALG